MFEFVAWDCDLDIDSESGETGAAGAAADVDDQVATLLARVRASLDDSPPSSDHTPEPAAEAEKPREPQGSAQPKAGKANSEVDVKSAPQTIRVDLDRVDRLIDLVGSHDGDVEFF